VSISIPFSTTHNAKYKFVIDWIVKILQTVMETIEVNQLEWSVRYNAVLLMKAFHNLLFSK
jgi:hypothetical protein